MRVAKRWIAVAGILIAPVLLAVCGSVADGWSVVPSHDVSQPTDFTLCHSNRLAGGPSGLSVHLTGQLDGEAEVWADNWQHERLSGRVDWRVYHDWFSPTCVLYYRPVGGRVSGQLTVRYQFHW